MQLQDSVAQFAASGIRIFAISPDTVGVQAAFAEEHAITYPLLSDADSGVIRAFGILNTLIRQDEPEFGIPYPGSYLVGADGRVISKSFHREYQVRDAPATVLRSGFDVNADRSSIERDVRSDTGVGISVTLGAQTLSFMQHADLYVSLALANGLHAYGRPIPDGYQAVEVRGVAPDGVRVGEPVYPPTRPLRIAGLDELFNVYEERAIIRVPIVLAVRPTDSLTRLTVNIEVGYQACTDQACFPPTREHVQIVINLAS